MGHPLQCFLRMARVGLRLRWTDEGVRPYKGCARALALRACGTAEGGCPHMVRFPRMRVGRLVGVRGPGSWAS